MQIQALHYYLHIASVCVAACVTWICWLRRGTQGADKLPALQALEKEVHKSATALSAVLQRLSQAAQQKAQVRALACLLVWLLLALHHSIMQITYR